MTLHRLAANLERVRERIAAAATRAGRETSEITLVAVTKYVTAAEAPLLVELGCRDLGESRPQELWSKAEALAGRGIRWHLIGPLQRNKVRRTLPLAELIHSVADERVLAEIDREAARIGRVQPVLLEVNLSGDAAKQGLAPEQLGQLIPRVAEFAHIEVRGLMGMSGLASDAAQTAAEFKLLAQLRGELRSPALPLAELSMGMSGDFEIAIEHGATIVRIGSALWEEAS